MTKVEIKMHALFSDVFWQCFLLLLSTRFYSKSTLMSFHNSHIWFKLLKFQHEQGACMSFTHVSEQSFDIQKITI